MKKSMWIGAVVCAAVLTTTSCSGDSSTATGPEESAYVEALAKTIAAENTFGGGADSATCLASGIVKTIGVRTLRESNIEPTDFATAANINLSGVGEKKVDDVVDFLLGGECVDMADALATSMRSSAGDSITEEQATCVASKFVKMDSFRRGFRASLTGSGDTATEDEMTTVRDLMVDCGVQAATTTTP